MLHYAEKTELDEEIDIGKSSYTGTKGQTFKIWVTGTEEELDFMVKNYVSKYWGDNKYEFNKKYNPNPVVDEKTGKPLWVFAPQKADTWTRLFWWKTTNPAFEEAQLAAIQNFIRDVNMGLAEKGGSSDPESEANPKLDAFLLKLEQLKDFIENDIVPTLSGVPQTKELIERKLTSFINELAEAVDDTDLLEKVQNYLSFASVFSYSFVNTFLIYIQNNKAREVLSIGDWEKLNMQPKDDKELYDRYGEAKAIGLWVPKSSSGGSLRNIIRAENKWREKFGYDKLPSDATFNDVFYNKKGNKQKLTYAKQLGLNKFVRKGLTQMSGISGFKVRFKFLDITDVEQIAGKEVAKMPKQPDWHTNEEDSRADEVYNAAIRVIQDLKIKFSEYGEGEKGGSKGYSSMQGEIGLLATNAGVGRASTAVHELAHSLTHQTYLKELYGIDEKVQKLQEKMRKKERITYQDSLTRKEKIIYDAYKGRQGTNIFGGNQILELQAEGVAFVVLRYYGIDPAKLKHSSTYIALWRGSKEAVTANLEIISQTAKSIISLMGEYMGEQPEDLEGKTDEPIDISDDEPLDEEEFRSFLYERSLSSLNNILNEVIQNGKTLLNGNNTKN